MLWQSTVFEDQRCGAGRILPATCRMFNLQFLTIFCQEKLFPFWSRPGATNCGRSQEPPGRCWSQSQEAEPPKQRGSATVLRLHLPKKG